MQLFGIESTFKLAIISLLKELTARSSAGRQSLGSTNLQDLAYTRGSEVSNHTPRNLFLLAGRETDGAQGTG